jgi:hypothetical protein
MEDVKNDIDTNPKSGDVKKSKFFSKARAFVLAATIMSTQAVAACSPEAPKYSPSESSQPTPIVEVIPTSSPTPKTTVEVPASPTRNPDSMASIIISPEAAKWDFERFTTRVPLSKEDLNAKNRIIEDLRRELNLPSGDIDGIIFQNTDVSIEYVSGPDDFEAEILTKDFDIAKQEAEEYLRGKGFSNSGICNLPLSYYLGAELRKILPDGTQFNPNPQVCAVKPSPSSSGANPNP